MQWLFDVMLKWEHNGAILMDATFETNYMKYHIFTLFVLESLVQDPKKCFDTMIHDFTIESRQYCSSITTKLFYRR